MRNRDVYQRDPRDIPLPNSGVAAMTDALTVDDRRTLRFELAHFVCEGEYRRGLVRVLESYINHQGQPQQPAAWVSGFFGSGKSHLAKMLRFLWTGLRLSGGRRDRPRPRLPARRRAGKAGGALDVGTARRRPARRRGHARHRRRRQRAAGAAGHRVQVHGSARGLSAGALLYLVAEETAPTSRCEQPSRRRGGISDANSTIST